MCSITPTHVYLFPTKQCKYKLFIISRLGKISGAVGNFLTVSLNRREKCLSGLLISCFNSLNIQLDLAQNTYI